MAGTDAATDAATNETATDAGTGTGAILDDRRERRRLPVVGLVLSALYVAGVTLYLFVQGQNPADLRLNELGDFLGGVSSPLGFLWLVLGFFQQSREIRLSGKALHLQASEMRRSVDEHRRLAGGAEERGKGERQGQD